MTNFKQFAFLDLNKFFCFEKYALGFHNSFMLNLGEG